MNQENLVKIVSASIVSLAIGLGAGYFIGKYYNEAVRVTNENVDETGPKSLLIHTRDVMNSTYFIEQDEGSFRRE